MNLNLRANLDFLRPVLFAYAGLVAAGPAAGRRNTRPWTRAPARPRVRQAPANMGGHTGEQRSNPLPQSPASPPHLIWTGFQPTATGSRVFFQTTGPVEFEVKEGHVSKGGHSTLTVLLRGCRIFMANNRRKLDTRAFPTPVQSVLAKQRRKNVELLITLREPASSTPGTESGPNGTRFLVFDFPPGKPAPIEEKAPAGVEAPPRGATSGDGWSLSGDGDSVKAEPRGRAKSKGRAAAASDRRRPGTARRSNPLPQRHPQPGLNSCLASSEPRKERAVHESITCFAIAYGVGRHWFLPAAEGARARSHPHLCRTTAVLFGR